MKKYISKSIMIVVVIMGMLLSDLSVLFGQDLSVLRKENEITTQSSDLDAHTIGPGGGGALFNPIVNPQDENNLLMTTDMSGSFTSVDGGKSWVQRNLGGSAKFSFSKHDPNVVYAYNTHIWVSHNKGLDYERFYPTKENIKETVSGIQEGVEFTYHDASATPKSRVMALEVDPDDPNTIYYFQRGQKNQAVPQLVKTTDNGKTWEVLAEWPMNTMSAWQYSPTSIEKYVKIHIDPESPKDERRIGLYTSDGFFEIIDNGSKTYETLSTMTSRNGDMYYDPVTKKMVIYAIENIITFDKNGNEVYTYLDLMKTEDEGRTWTNISNGSVEPEAGSDITYYGVAVYDENVYLTYTSSKGEHNSLGTGVAKSTDGGKTWETVLKGWDSKNIVEHNWTELFSARSLSVAWNGLNRGVSVCKSNPDIVMVSTHGNAYISRDGGATWYDTNSDFDAETAFGKTRGVDQITSWDVDVDPFDDQHMFISYSDVGLFESKDGGDTWRRSQNNGIPHQSYYSNSAYSLEFDPDIEGLVFAGMNGCHDLNIGTYIIDILKLADLTKQDENKSGFRWVGGILRSTDGGATWSATGTLGTQPVREDDGITGLPDRAMVTSVVIDPNSPKEIDKRVVYASCIGYGVYRSTDGGIHWEKYNMGMEDEPYQMPWRLEYNADYSRLYVVFAQMGGGAKTGTEEGKLALIDYHPGDGPVYYLERGQDTWTKLASMPSNANSDANMESSWKGNDYVSVFSGVSFDSKGNIYASGKVASLNGAPGKREFGGGWVSGDDGHTWKLIYPSNENVYDLQVDSRNDNVLYLCNTTGGEVYVSYKGADTTFDDWIKLDGFQFTVPTRVIEDSRDPKYMYTTTFGGGVWHLELPQPVVTEQHTITYDGNGITAGAAPVDTNATYAKKSKVKVLGTATMNNTGKTFIGWNTKADGSGDMYQENDEYYLVRNTVLYAQWRDTNTKLNVVYDANDATSGSVPVDSDSPYTLNSEVTVLDNTDLEKDGYRFVGWNTKADGSGTDYVADDTFVAVDDVTLYAQFSKLYTVTYHNMDATEGDTPVDTKQYIAGERADILSSAGLEKDGYVHRGWSTSEDYTGGVYKEGSSIPIKGDVNLYAYWKPELHMYYDGNGNTHGSAPVDSNRYADIDVIKALDYGTLVKENYEFDSWNTEPDGSGTTYKLNAQFMIKEDLTLYAQWKKLEEKEEDVTVVYSKNLATSGSAPVDANSPYAYGSLVKVMDKGDLERDGYIFAGWRNIAVGGSKIYKPGQYMVVTSNVLFYPQWVDENDVTYNITYNGNGQTAGSKPIDINAPYKGSEKATILGQGTLLKDGFEFVGWNTQADGRGITYQPDQVVQFDGDVTLYAQWRDKSIPLSVSYDANGATSGSVPVDTGSPYTLKDPVVVADKLDLVKDGYIFTGWNTSPKGSGDSYQPNETFNILNDTVLYAQWSKELHVTYHGTQAESGSVPTDSTIYVKNDTVTVKDNVDLLKENHFFLGWNTKEDYSGTLYKPNATFAIREDVDLYAQWVPAKKIIYDGNGHTHGSVPVDPKEYNENERAKLAYKGDLVKDGYEFKGWNTEADGSGKTYRENDPVIMTSQLKLYAKWEKVTDTSKEWTVVYYAADSAVKGSAPVDANSPYKNGDLVQLKGPGDMKKEGYKFVGWTNRMVSAPIIYKEGQYVTITNDMIMWSLWEKVDAEAEKFTLTYDGNGHTSGSVPVDTSSPYLATDSIQAKAVGDLARDGYTFAGWNTKADGKGIAYNAGDTFTISSDTILYAQWTKDAVYEVNYTFVSQDPSLTLPSDVTDLLPSKHTNVANGATVNKVDPTTTSVVDNAKGGTWQFVGYDVDSITINKANATFTGTWKFVPNTFEVDYKFIANDGSTLPSDVTALLPSKHKNVANGVTVNKVDPTSTSVVDNAKDGTWKFVGYDVDSITINKANATFTGTWKFVANTYEVDYKFVAKDGSVLPSDVTDLLPSKHTGKVHGDSVVATQPLVDEVVVSDGKWVFNGYDTDPIVVNKASATFTGEWEYIANPVVNEYVVNYKFESEDSSILLPSELMDFLPTEHQNVHDTDVINATLPSQTTYVDTANDGVWEFVGYNVNTYTIAGKNETFTGTWRFTANEYEVDYTFVSNDGSPLPLEVLNLLPQKHEQLVNGNVVTLTQPTSTSVTVTGGKWVFKGYGMDNITINKQDATATGTWEFVADTPTVKYSITYYVVEADGSYKAVKVEFFNKDEVVLVLDGSTFKREGYTFVGWNTSKDGSGTMYDSNASLTISGANVELYAIWKKDVVTPPKDDTTPPKDPSVPPIVDPSKPTDPSLPSKGNDSTTKGSGSNVSTGTQKVSKSVLRNTFALVGSLAVIGVLFSRKKRKKS
ncbi:MULTISPECIES: InlB B-repeat-containing protein [unclassified Breznakia]|uniref:InlB B-repeat-containing protein n=1 Tax=unclassified Breznakia TaxID=2623764 RepID=UPI00247477D7|nr:MULTISPECIES: InlB B-repeat-containing protein [unclassified Breznakia]MDH6365880.1 putative repeat protein (TIGR02543 family) [Breznakia sp. PH1-1]MDH6403188.1 putative repeat protein (TIGR02543 family) [Breznakia sp. PF1-11]MDH6410897.1 putative repeat protein (TIGR02543 family) [Breznakia sp. PFB1-11]MDH6413046.1 putative repeat protein (TIGR02543 family) [Breznakia sp. PFB1-14]MDH6415414.1 putative repeat protein (TIGR02543 family) [Breznakia sp. PFB1-4]